MARERRHLTREQRQEVVARLRAEGWSYRRIGERLGVDPMTAKHDADAGVENSTPAPAVVTGADGKTYPATKPAVVTTNAKDRDKALGVLQSAPDAASYLRGCLVRMTPREKGARTDQTSSQNVTRLQAVADEAGVSRMTLHRDASFADAVDTLAATVGEEVRELATSGRIAGVLRVYCCCIAAVSRASRRPQERRRGTRQGGSIGRAQEGGCGTRHYTEGREHGGHERAHTAQAHS